LAPDTHHVSPKSGCYRCVATCTLFLPLVLSHYRKKWDHLISALECIGKGSPTPGPPSRATQNIQCWNMTTSYTYLLACYKVHGPMHSITLEAFECSKAADPEGWVPQLLAGLALPPPAMGPSMILTSKKEAVVSRGGGWCRSI
jgi:hypothetical protein